MPITHQKLMRRRITRSAAALFAIFMMGHLLDLLFDWPSPRQARAALARRGWCEADAPIVRQNGKVFIGRYECHLDGGHPGCSGGDWDLGIFEYQRTCDWCPFFGHWYVRRPWHEGISVE